MEQKPITNPMLVGTIELMKAEDTVEHRRMFVDEMMKARFLSPVVMTPEPKPDENGVVRVEPGCKVQFPMLTAPDGKQFLMAFTDGKELKKWQKLDKQPTFALTFDDYAGMLLGKNKEGSASPASGFVINPYGGNIMVTKDMVAALMVNKLRRSGFVPKKKPVTAPEQGQAQEPEQEQVREADQE